MFNAVWLTIVTITSVGYGDVFPHTNAGKVLAMIAALWGAFLMALLVVAATSSFKLDINQTKALKHINLSKSAAKTINLAAKYFLAKKKFYIEVLKYNP